MSRRIAGGLTSSASDLRKWASEILIKRSKLTLEQLRVIHYHCPGLRSEVFRLLHSRRDVVRELLLDFYSDRGWGVPDD